MRAFLFFRRTKMAKRTERHKTRIGTSSGFAIHLRGAGVDQQKMDETILDYLRMESDLLGQETRPTEFNARMSIEAIARGDYQPDRACSLEGPSANVREKLRYMKYLGFIRKDGFRTQVLTDYVGALNANNSVARLNLLQHRIARWKLRCPQGAGGRWTPKQNGYRHYRIRLGIMFLYGLKSAEDHGVEIDTDDLTLTALRFFTPARHERVDEEFLKNHIDQYFASKAESLPDYRAEFESQMDRVERDLGENLRANDPCAFARKCRNAANDAYCLIILMRNVSLIEAPNCNTAIEHWSATQESYDHTGKVPEFNIVTLTDTGRQLLAESIELLPIWYEDICTLIPSEEHEGRARMVFYVNKLCLDNNIPQDTISDDEIDCLSTLGVSGRCKNRVFIPDRRPVFELQYDMP
jgi:hypothetical protein